MSLTKYVKKEITRFIFIIKNDATITRGNFGPPEQMLQWCCGMTSPCI